MTTTSDPNPLTTQRGAAPLTTVFTTPDFCNDVYWTNTITPPLSSVVCMPTMWHQLYDYSWGYYSPGICPSGYTEGCAFPTSLATSSDEGGIRLGGPVVEGETARLCCPTGHTCYTDSLAYSKCISTVPTTSFYNSDNQPTSQLALVFAVQVRWRASDLSILETDPTVPGATYTGLRSTGVAGSSGATAAPSTGTGGGTGTRASGSAPTATATATATSTTATDGSGTGGGGSQGISVGTTIAIAVGSVAGTLVLALLAFVLLWRRRRRRRRGDAQKAASHHAHDSDAKSDSLAAPALLAHKAASGRTSLDITSPRPVSGTTVVGDGPLHSPHMPTATADAATGTGTTTQLDSTAVMEMETLERPQELPDDNAVFEMEGDMPGPPLYREKEGWPLRW